MRASESSVRIHALIFFRPLLGGRVGPFGYGRTDSGVTVTGAGEAGLDPEGTGLDPEGTGVDPEGPGTGVDPEDPGDTAAGDSRTTPDGPASA